MDLSNKVVIVTGSTSGIGEAIAREFASRKAKVVITGRRLDEGTKIQESIVQEGKDCSFIQCDISNEEQVKNLVEKTVNIYGKLDIAVNSAGIVGDMKPLIEYTGEDWNKVISTNLTGLFYSMKYQIPQMIKNGGGSILNISSALGFVGKKDVTTYSATKHAVIGLTKSAALEYGQYNIRINTLCPGGIVTAMDNKFYENVENPEKLKKERLKSYVLGRMGMAEEVAKAAIWLSSDENSFMTGSAVVCDGGKLAS